MVARHGRAKPAGSRGSGIGNREADHNESVTPSAGNNDLVIAWSAVEGGTYQVTSGDTCSITSYTQGTGSTTVSFNDSTLAVGTAYPAILTFTPPGQTARTVTSTITYTR